MEIDGADLRFEDVVAIQSTSAVYKMQHPQLGALALKCVDSSAQLSLAHEAKVLRVLHGLPHVAEFVAFLPSVEATTSTFPKSTTTTTTKSVLVERFYKAAAVHKLFFEFPHLAEDVVRHVLVQLIAVLEAVHGRGVVFVDVKLPNILLARNGVVTLVDFGSAVIVDGAASATTVDDSQNAAAPTRSTSCPASRFLTGTPHVRPPEVCAASTYPEQQALDLEDPFAIDKWALGVCAYELLCGQPLCGSFDVVAGAALALRGASISWGSCGWVSSDARAFVEALLRVDPSERVGAKSWAAIRHHPFLAAHNVESFVLPEAYEEEIDMQTLGL